MCRIFHSIHKFIRIVIYIPGKSFVTKNKYYVNIHSHTPDIQTLTNIH